MNCRLRITLLASATGGCFVATLLWMLCSKQMSMADVWGNVDDTSNSCNIGKANDEIRKLVLGTLKHLAVAHRYARSAKTLQEIGDAYSLSRKALFLMNVGGVEPIVDPQELTLANIELINAEARERNTGGALVCPEFFKGPTYGYPFYFTGFEMPNYCSNIGFNQVISVIINFAGEVEPARADRIFSGINLTNYTNLHYVTITHSNEQAQHVLNSARKYQILNTTTVIVPTSALPVELFLQSLSVIRTEYTFIVRNLEYFDEFARLERLVRMASQLKLHIVAGSHRNDQGHWSAACFQVAMRNYTLRLVEGYDLSHNSCLYCDYSSGPFLVKTSFLKQYAEWLSRKKYSPTSSFVLFYFDLFLTAKRKGGVSMVCPDAMYHTRTIGFIAPEKSVWLGFVQRWELSRLVFPDNSDLWFTCTDARMTCVKAPGLILPLCCFKVLTDCLNFATTLMDQNQIGYELDTGSVAGSVKLLNTLPWERDHDLSIRTQNISSLMQLQDRFQQQGYTLEEDNVDYKKCISNLNCGFVLLRCPGWRIELWGLTQLASDIWTEKGVANVTRGVVGGPSWLTLPPSPAGFIRNRYGDDVFKHAEHWRGTGKRDSWQSYQEGMWTPCPRPHFHGCLTNYLPVGNLQFIDVWI